MEILARQMGLVALGFSAECQCPDPHIHTTKIIKRLRINDQNRKSNLVSMSKKRNSNRVHLLLAKFCSLNFFLRCLGNLHEGPLFLPNEFGIRYCLFFGRLKICIINSTWFHRVFKECGRLSLTHPLTLPKHRN